MTPPVSRETSSAAGDGDEFEQTPPVPAVAQGVFGSRLPSAVAYAEWLAGEGVVRGLIGPREVPRIWDRHLLNCAVVQELVPEGVTVADVGSGAGLPGVALALARPDVSVTLVEPLLRRARFLTEVVEALELGTCEVVRARAEELAGAREFDVVTSRAVAPLPKLLRWSVPLTAPTGVVLALKGSRAIVEIEDAGPTVRELRCGTPELRQVGAGILDPQPTVVRVARAGTDKVG